MQERGSVFVVQLDEMVSNNLAAALRQFRWRVRVFDSVMGLQDQLQTQVADTYVLSGAPAGVPGLVALLRRVAPGAAVVWQACGVTAVERAAALDAGVDACAPVGMESLEWDALLRNLYRRTRPSASSWRVDAPARVLAGPAGERLPLTARERAFFVRLLNAPGQCLQRERFFPSDARDPSDGARRVDVVVSRLRSKARRFNIELPVLAVRGWGYMLLPPGGPTEPTAANRP
ncbi:winged helix-turn-helix domain-containing protein [Achromobacter deleyi]|uniref:winged helix-turn-helix domain-containing protein n=1 Tax=Achromobacter deleyi TaxID=1353891 RepID=UPI001490B4B5|nr:winged helix-turn-helix domain-containing protein [Achromobacter deleyi]QVQ25812.1 response regulator transcription factor [Achromobacter deleyi]UIP21351.1 winged helix-turn-helix domain-containing protein [Achromobacter deleyi]